MKPYSFHGSPRTTAALLKSVLRSLVTPDRDSTPQNVYPLSETEGALYKVLGDPVTFAPFRTSPAIGEAHIRL